MKLFHPSVELVQHSDKGLDGALALAENAGARGAQPSNFLLEDGKGGFLSAKDVRAAFEKHKLLLDGVSAHCITWVHGSAWNGTVTVKKFLSPDVAAKSPEGIEQWAEDYLLRLLDLCSELNVYIVPMFWGQLWDPQVISGYPWGMWKGPGYDLIQEGNERFVTKTARLRREAREREIKLCHEIHPGTGAQCARDFLHVVNLCDRDECLAVNADPSHCSEGEPWQLRFDRVGPHVYGCHMKNHHVWPGEALRCMAGEWPDRPMQFTPLDRGDIDLVRYTELMIRIGYASRYRQLCKTETAPLVVEAEAAYQPLDPTSKNGVQFTRDVCCFDVTTESFEKGMGAKQS